MRDLWRSDTARVVRAFASGALSGIGAISIFYAFLLNEWAPFSEYGPRHWMFIVVCGSIAAASEHLKQERRQSLEGRRS